MLKSGNICLKHIYLHNTIPVFAWYASMYALNVTVKTLAILTKVVISLAFSKILAEANAKTAKLT